MAKEYSATGAKKWLVLVGVVVLIAICIVAIVLAIPANTYSMIESLEQSEQTYLLKDANEKKNYSTFRSKVNSNAQTRYYNQELIDVETLSTSMSVVLKYYSDFMVFANSNKVMSSNYKKIRSNISKAGKYQDKIDKILEDASKLEGSSVTLLQNSMIDFRKEFCEYVNSYYNAFVSLNNCYQGCFGESYSNNAASTQILNAVNDYIYTIVNDYKVLISSDRKGETNSSNYSYKSRYKIYYLNKFVNEYIADRSEIRNYMFNETTQAKYEKINRFFSLYNEKDFTQLIITINQSGVQKTYGTITNDPDSLVYKEVKNFLV